MARITKSTMNAKGPATLSPMASEFTLAPNFPDSIGYHGLLGPSIPPAHYYNPLNLANEKNWVAMVEKICVLNDQQCSILLQQKIKSVDRHDRIDICNAIVFRVEQLICNRFGNFLVQRCLENGTEHQLAAIATALRGRVVRTSMDAFGCHVIQKALDVLPENMKLFIVYELLEAIGMTVMHRYACHVWQKMFELSWECNPPRIMDRINHDLRGKWAQVAMGETRSLVVQNIFENCKPEEKGHALEEVLADCDDIARGQYGNWCVQHIIEHGEIPYQTRAIEVAIHRAVHWSHDQFASKVIEKTLKLNPHNFVNRYVGVVMTHREGRTRLPVVDLAADQYGNYLVQFLLQFAEDRHRDMISAVLK